MAYDAGAEKNSEIGSGRHVHKNKQRHLLNTNLRAMFQQLHVGTRRDERSRGSMGSGNQGLGLPRVQRKRLSPLFMEYLT